MLEIAGNTCEVGKRARALGEVYSKKKKKDESSERVSE